MVMRELHGFAAVFGVFQPGPIDFPADALDIFWSRRWRPGGSWFGLSQAAGQRHLATAGPAVVRLGRVTDNDERIVYSAPTPAQTTPPACERTPTSH